MAAPRKKPELPTRGFTSLAKLEAWLEEHHASSDGLWLKIAKKDSGRRSVTYPEAVEAALCFGWIDGQSRRVDEQFYALRFTPRRPRSIWSKRNVEHVARLTAEGRMRPAGLAAVEAAKADGRWDAAYDGMKDATVPADLQAVLDREPEVAAFWAGLSGPSRYAVTHRLQTATTPQARARRFETLVGGLREGRAPHAG